MNSHIYSKFFFFFWEIKALLQLWRGIKQPSLPSPHPLLTIYRQQILTHIVTEWGQLSSLFKRAAVSASYKCLCVFMCLCERVWMDCFVLTSERKHKPTAALRNYRKLSKNVMRSAPNQLTTCSLSC